MKLKTTSLLTVSILAAATLFMTTSCKKSNSSSSAAGTISASIHDSGFQSQAAYSAGIFSQSQNSFDLTGLATSKTDTSIFEIYINGPIRLNAPISTDTVGSFFAYSDENVKFDWQAGNGGGTVVYTVTSNDTVNHKIAGTFSGSLYDLLNTSGITVDSILVTNGKFNLSYIVQP